MFWVLWCTVGWRFGWVSFVCLGGLCSRLRLLGFWGFDFWVDLLVFLGFGFLCGVGII